MNTARITLVLITLLGASGCDVGHNRMLFFTKSNVGLDLDTQPPTAEITIARREGVIEPTFEDGQTLPVMASFTSRSSAAGRLLGGVGLSFATGEAAVAMAKFHGAGDVPRAEVDAFLAAGEDSLELSEVPSSSGWFGLRKKEPYPAGEMAPLIFGTDSSLGLKVGTGGQGTSATIAFGFRRKELAWSPITIAEKETAAGEPAYEVRTPSLLATLDSDYEAEAGTAGAKAGLRYVQYFATGKAATYLAMKESVRTPILARIIPETLSGEAALEHNRGLAQELHQRVAFLPIPSDAAAFDGDEDALLDARDEAKEVLVDLHRIARELGYLEEDVAGLEELETPEEVRVRLAEALAERAETLVDNDGLTRNKLNALLALVDESAF